MCSDQFIRDYERRVAELRAAISKMEADLEEIRSFLTKFKKEDLPAILSYRRKELNNNGLGSDSRNDNQ